MYNYREGAEKTRCIPCDSSSGRVFWIYTRTANTRDRVQRVRRTPPHAPTLSRCPQTASTTGILLRQCRMRGGVRVSAHRRTLCPSTKQFSDSALHYPAKPIQSRNKRRFLPPGKRAKRRKAWAQAPVRPPVRHAFACYASPPPEKSFGAGDVRPQAPIRARFFPYAEYFFEVTP